MSEMLGNRYFLGRNFRSAALQYEDTLHKINTIDIEVVKKLIVCYTKVNRTDDALNYYYSLLKKIQYSTDNLIIENEDCPYKKIIEELIIEMELEGLQYSTSIKLGILNSYCSSTNGIKYFKKALEFSRNKKIIKQIINILEGKKHRSNN
jgi:hypothetical protein